MNYIQKQTLNPKHTTTRSASLSKERERETTRGDENSSRAKKKNPLFSRENKQATKRKKTTKQTDDDFFSTETLYTHWEDSFVREKRVLLSLLPRRDRLFFSRGDFRNERNTKSREL